MSTKKDVEERLRKRKAEIVDYRFEIADLKRQLEEAKAVQLSPEVARKVLGENDDMILELLKGLVDDVASEKVQFRLRGIIAHISGQSLAEFLQNE